MITKASLLIILQQNIPLPGTEFLDSPCYGVILSNPMVKALVQH